MIHNRLATEDSPYLQQHKNNPVAWFAWCDEAFVKAKEQNKPIFISIGYSSCHWCHVMEEQVFENLECAKILNDSFICIKVDREERPDIDKYYQDVHMLLNRRPGGWPTSIFCTPNNKPFYAATYIPPHPLAGQQGMGFIELTSLIASKVAENDPKLFLNADEIQGFLQQKEHPKEATVLKEDIVKNFLLQAKNNYETKYGGFSVAPKFPHATTLDTLLTIDALYHDKAAHAMIKTTLDSMVLGGLYDLVDGGFCRYSVDDKFLVPHFEKMLYDNALLCKVYAKSYLAYKNEHHLEIAKEIADFWEEFMSEENLFYSASDADTEGIEGEYFVYTYAEVYEALANAGYEDIEIMLDELSVTHHGNFEGKNIIRFEDLHPLPYFADVKKILAKIRTQRTYPFRDKKIQTSWSSMMIESLFFLGSIDANYKQKAINALEALMAKLYVDGVLYHTALVDKKPKVEAFLEDYAFLISALLSAYKATQEDLYLIQAQRLTNKALEDFYNNSAWNFSINEFVTKAEATDSTYTSSVSVMVGNLLTLGALLEDEKYTHFAFKTLEYNSYELGRRPIYYPHMLQQMLRYLKKDFIIKSSKEQLHINSTKLASLSYPFVLHKNNDEDGFLVCSTTSCFSFTEDIDTLEDIINSLKR
ncbi:MAG: thioredoxin domain-containing protein [Sulfurimonadaceae bacterium]|jgi:uncharacterized protein YyaL (SSP411 family)|nr:thioredoxin domain-containing protein [Sulfurimonadaceae bacterium]